MHLIPDARLVRRGDRLPGGGAQLPRFRIPAVLWAAGEGPHDKTSRSVVCVRRLDAHQARGLSGPWRVRPRLLRLLEDVTGEAVAAWLPCDAPPSAITIRHHALPGRWRNRVQVLYGARSLSPAKNTRRTSTDPSAACSSGARMGDSKLGGSGLADTSGIGDEREFTENVNASRSYLLPPTSSPPR